MGEITIAPGTHMRHPYAQGVRVGILTREWPPDIYGGAGVHVEHLVAGLRPLVDVHVQCFGPPRGDAMAHSVPADLSAANPALQTLGVDLQMAMAANEVNLVHSHTWYANLAGHLAALLYDVPHVVTAHSLEPFRPWKQEQLGGGYRVSSWVEATAYGAAAAIIAVSAGMRRDVLQAYPQIDPSRVHVVHNGIDTATYHYEIDEDILLNHGIDPQRPYVLFVGRITRQKGLSHLLRAAHAFADDLVLVMCASSPDTPELAAETEEAVRELQQARGMDSVRWIQAQVPRQDLIALLSGARAFICPSIYEPLGIVNLEAMACQAPVVASDVGGIPEVVIDGETGLLVHYDAGDPVAFASGLAEAINRLAADPHLAREMGLAGRQRAVTSFGWEAIAEQTLEVYRGALTS